MEWQRAGEKRAPIAVSRFFAAAVPAQDAVATAHERLLAETGLQFDFPLIEPPETPWWLRWIGELLEFLSPVFQVLFWAGVAFLVGVIVYFFVREAIRARWPEKKKASDPARAVHWQPKLKRARAVLADADRLAAEGRFAEAVHLLLFRSIDDIEEWQPHLLKPDLTSRDIGALEVLPPEARRIFARIAEAVETSFFGGADVDAQIFAECRSAYAGFALAERRS
jgi:hypothetical protein